MPTHQFRASARAPAPVAWAPAMDPAVAEGAAQLKARDPAFDPAFCTTHLLLKAVWSGEARLNDAAAALVAAYRAAIGWEDAGGLLLRAGKLAAALLLARVEGTSPAPYLTDPEHKRLVRDQARALIMAPQPIDALVANWKRTSP